ncbi:MAG: sigma-70 family RNA polymerase sigma factor [Flavisolibacter sp.]|nr:sigma-70 family RNA polymerase sigma factor [Flavisolibacter sp.]
MISNTTYSQDELVEKLKLREEQAFRLLYDNYNKSLFTIIYQVVQQQEVAEDILQQVFIRIWKSIDSFDPCKGRLFTWMLNIARNLAIDHTRSKEFNRQSKTVALSESVYENEKTASISIRDSGLVRLIEKLPEGSRKILELSYFLGYTQDEIARILEIPIGTVKTRLRATIIELRKIMVSK